MSAAYINEEFENVYAVGTKQILESIKQVEERPNCLSSSESDGEGVGLKENCAVSSETITEERITRSKRVNKRKKGKNKKSTFEDSIILEDEIDDYVSIGGKYGKSNSVSEGAAVNCLVDNSIIVVDNEERVNTCKPKTVTDLIVIDDVDISGIDLQNRSNTNDSVAKQPLRSRKRLKTKRNVNYMEKSVIVDDSPVPRRTRHNRRTARRSSNDDIPVITFDEDCEIPQCSYINPSQKNAVSSKKNLDADKATNYDMTSETVTVFVSWRGNDCEKFEVPRYRPLKTIFDHYAELEDIPVTYVVLTKDSDLLTPKDTPDSAEFKCIQFLRGFKTNVEQNFENKVTKPVVVDENDVELKVLLKNKRPLMLTIKKNHSMKVIIAKCAAQLECPEEDVVLFVDGEKIDTDDTPEDLDLQSGECVDAHVKNSK